MVTSRPPFPLYPPLTLLNEHLQVRRPINNDVRSRLDEFPSSLKPYSTWQMGLDFLAEQRTKSDFGERHYNNLCPIIESMMHWSWSIRHKCLEDWCSNDADDFMHFIMRPPASWVSTAGGSRYARNTRMDFADKRIYEGWRPIFRKSSSGSDPGLSSYHHLQWFLGRGREFFDYLASAPAWQRPVVNENPFRDVRPKDFEVREKKARTCFTPEQLQDLLDIAESLAQKDDKWEPLLFMMAVAVHSEIPLRALGSTPTIKATFSHFFDPTSRNDGDTRGLQPRAFESPHYPGKRYFLASAFGDCFRRFAQYRHERDSDVNARSFMFPLEHGADAYGNGSLIGLFGKFTAQILKELRSGRLACSMYWKWSDKLAPDATLAFLELRNSARAAGMIPKVDKSVEVEPTNNVWPDIGIRQGLPGSQWFHEN
ncbi:hypothetical protein ACYZT7_17440 [Pseudomonas sp. RT4P38]